MVSLRRSGMGASRSLRVMYETVARERWFYFYCLPYLHPEWAVKTAYMRYILRADKKYAGFWDLSKKCDIGVFKKRVLQKQTRGANKSAHIFWKENFGWIQYGFLDIDNFF